MDFAQHVKSSINIVSVVNDHVRLKKQGPNRWVGLCPFHTEKTASFSVHEALQIYKCFGCGKGGDVFNFLMELQGLTFFEALKALAEQHGIPLPRRADGELGEDGPARLRSALYRMHELAQEMFRERLLSAEGAAARAYLQRRGLDADAATEFGLGFAPSSGRLVATLQREGMTAEQMEQSGLVARRQDGTGFYERFRDRLVFPIVGETGKIIAFGGRSLRDDQQPKYLNSPETAIYKKSATLYNLHRAKAAMRRLDRAVLVEGYMDVIGVARAGVGEVTASCGTALTSHQARMLLRQTGAVVVNFDGDSAGQEATERSIQILLQEGLSVRVLALPPGLDPDDYCRQNGAEAYRGLLDQAPDYFVWLADQARKRFDLRTAEGTGAAFRFLMPAINLLPDKITRASLADELAQYLRVDRGLVLEQLRRSAAERHAAPEVRTADVLSSGEKLLLRLLVQSQEARQEMLEPVAAVAVDEGFAVAPIIEAMRVVVSTEGEFQYTALEARLEESHRAMLSHVLFERDIPACSMEEGRNALAALRQQVWEKRYRSIRREIADAEKSGDREKVLSLVQAKTELARKLGLLGRQAEAAGR